MCATAHPARMEGHVWIKAIPTSVNVHLGSMEFIVLVSDKTSYELIKGGQPRRRESKSVKGNGK